MKPRNRQSKNSSAKQSYPIGITPEYHKPSTIWGVWCEKKRNPEQVAYFRRVRQADEYAPQISYPKFYPWYVCIFFFHGISYADLNKLSWKDIITEADGSLGFPPTDKKTKNYIQCKLLDVPIRIMEHYKGIATDGKVFPLMSLGQGKCRIEADSEKLRYKPGLYPTMLQDTRSPVKSACHKVCTYRKCQPDDGT